MGGMSDEEWRRMTGGKAKAKPATKTAEYTESKDPVNGSVSDEARRSMSDASTIRGKVKARKDYLDSL